MNKKIVLASDHGGFELKEKLIKYLKENKFDVVDLGPNTDQVSVSYALYGKKLAEYLLENKDFLGIGICGTGLGISYSLNRHKGIRAARVTSVNDAYLAKLHNNANVLVFGGRFTEYENAVEMFDKYISTDFEGGRHITRIEELDK